MPRYLIVDDSPTIRLALSLAIKKSGRTGLELLEAATGNEAMEKFLKSRPDVIFLDLNLGGGPSGLSVLKSMLAHQPEAKIVLVTGFPGSHPEVVAAVSLGAFAYLEKPVRGDTVANLLRSIDQEEGRMGRIR